MTSSLPLQAVRRVGAFQEGRWVVCTWRRGFYALAVSLPFLAGVVFFLGLQSRFFAAPVIFFDGLFMLVLGLLALGVGASRSLRSARRSSGLGRGAAEERERWGLRSGAYLILFGSLYLTAGLLIEVALFLFVSPFLG
jgi:hypothetical protein